MEEKTVNIVEQLRQLNSLLNQAVDIAHSLPPHTIDAVELVYDNEQEALLHAIHIRLGILNRGLENRGIAAAQLGEVLHLEARIQEIAAIGHPIREPKVDRSVKG